MVTSIYFVRECDQDIRFLLLIQLLQSVLLQSSQPRQKNKIQNISRKQRLFKSQEVP
jgi:hypothetical protein